MQAPKTKQEMYNRLMAGEFGNTFRMWLSIAHAASSGYTGKLGMRSLAIANPFHTDQKASAQDAAAVKDWAGKFYTDVVLVEDIPTHNRLFNGELTMGVYGPMLRWGVGNKHMRASLEEGNVAYGIFAWGLLRTYVPSADLDWILHLCETYTRSCGYQSAAIEFTVFGEDVGTLKRPTIIWEVRDY